MIECGMYLPEPSFKQFFNATGWGGLAPWKVFQQADKDLKYMREGPPVPYEPSGPRWKDVAPVQAQAPQAKRKPRGSILVPEWKQTSLLI